jgi:pyruvate,orthophosphate dikinase
VHEGLITPAQALQRLAGIDAAALTRRHLLGPLVAAAQGIGASAGVAVGRAAFDAESAARRAARGEAVILLRPDTSTADVGGFAAAAGIVTTVGGRTAHAALVARQMGKPCIVGCAALTIDEAARRAALGAAAIKEGDWLSIDGDSGAVYLGRCEMIAERPEAELAEIESWRLRDAG